MYNGVKGRRKLVELLCSNYWLMVIDKERTELPLETKYKLSRERDLVSLPLGSNRLIDSSWLHFIFEVIF